MFFILRHGERADFSYNDKERSRVIKDFDPPLTQIGLNQADVTGKFIKKIIKSIDNEKKIPIIISSPFLRCVETSLQIAEKFDNIFNESIYIEDCLGEYMQRTWFSYNIIDELFIKTNKLKEESLKKRKIVKGFLDKRKSIDLQPKYPEDFIVFFKRIQNTLKSIAEKFFKEISSKNLFVIIVTHGYAVQVLLNNYAALQKLEISEYCSITLLKYFQDLKHDILISATNSHLTESKL